MVTHVTTCRGARWPGHSGVRWPAERVINNISYAGSNPAIRRIWLHDGPASGGGGRARPCWQWNGAARRSCLSYRTVRPCPPTFAPPLSRVIVAMLARSSGIAVANLARTAAVPTVRTLPSAFWRRNGRKPEHFMPWRGPSSGMVLTLAGSSRRPGSCHRRPQLCDGQGCCLGGQLDSRAAHFGCLVELRRRGDRPCARYW